MGCTEPVRCPGTCKLSVVAHSPTRVLAVRTRCRLPGCLQCEHGTLVKGPVYWSFFTVSFIFSIKNESSSFGRQDSCDLRFDPTRVCVSTTGAEEVSARGGNPTTLRALVTSALRCVP